MDTTAKHSNTAADCVNEFPVFSVSVYVRVRVCVFNDSTVVLVVRLLQYIQYSTWIVNTSSNVVDQFNSIQSLSLRTFYWNTIFVSSTTGSHYGLLHKWTRTTTKETTRMWPFVPAAIAVGHARRNATGNVPAEIARTST